MNDVKCDRCKSGKSEENGVWERVVGYNGPEKDSMGETGTRLDYSTFDLCERCLSGYRVIVKKWMENVAPEGGLKRRRPRKNRSSES